MNIVLMTIKYHWHCKVYTISVNVFNKKTAKLVKKSKEFDVSVNKKSIQIGIETHKEEIYQNLTRKNKLKTEFALVRLDKKVMWEVSHKVSSYQTLVRAPDVFIIQPRMQCYQSLVTKLTCKFAY